VDAQKWFVKVAVAGPFWQPLDYVSVQGALAPGVRVRVPFRRQTRVGLVVACDTEAGYDEAKIKPIEAVLDAAPLFSPLELRFLAWAAGYYHEPIGEVVMAALPKRLRAGEPNQIEGQTEWFLTQAGLQISLDSLAKNAHKQRALWAALRQQPSWTESQLNQAFDHWRALLRRWQDLGWLQTRTTSCLAQRALPTPCRHKLNAQQQQAVDQVLQGAQGFQTYLLQGVTGSGKTEVYLALIEAVLARGQQVLVLVPEIGLTPQTLARFEAHLQQPVVALHSGLNDSERHCAWHLVREGTVQVLLGTRSAVFAPMQRLGLCILDEEHDLSFKQQDGFRYSARDLVIRRAQLSEVPVVLGSATPSLESLFNVRQGRYRHLLLTERAAQAQMPKMTLLDIRGERLVEGVSAPLRAAMMRHLAAGNQVLVFLNRRGFSPVLMCHGCGWQARCPSCDANLTYHQVWSELRCHHCGHVEKAPSVCPDCGAKAFVPIGQGTERLEQVLGETFADYPVLRIDRDTTRRKGALVDKLAQIHQGEAAVLIGTQMLAKGHHFPQVTLVGLIDLDQGLFSVDFRAAERMAQLVVQVAGRAGRGTQPGEVLIQTHHPQHPLLLTLVRQGYDAFAEQALAQRAQAQLPPYCFQILLRAESLLPTQALTFLGAVKNALLSTAVAQPCEMWGPVSAPMERRQGRYRYQLLLQSSDRRALHQWLNAVQGDLANMASAARVRWSLDIDPQEMR
jgi:primosomal protein N' (replication factor Y)